MSRDALAPFSGPRYRENEKRCAEGETPCVLCGRGVRDDGDAPVVEVAWDRFVLPGEEADPSDPGYQGGWPVGPECARKLRAAGVLR